MFQLRCGSCHYASFRATTQDGVDGWTNKLLVIRQTISQCREEPTSLCLDGFIGPEVGCMQPGRSTVPQKYLSLRNRRYVTGRLWLLMRRANTMCDHLLVTVNVASLPLVTQLGYCMRQALSGRSGRYEACKFERRNQQDHRITTSPFMMSSPLDSWVDEVSQ